MDSRQLLRETRRKLSAAYCTAAELYLTDLCLEEDAERECEDLVDLALRLTIDDDDGAPGGGGVAGEPTVDALQTATSLRLSQSRGAEAVDYILKACRQMRAGCRALASLVGVASGDESSPDDHRAQQQPPPPQQQEARELLELEAVQNLPEFEFRCQTAKLLLECAAELKGIEGTGAVAKDDPRRHQCLQASVDVLGSLLAENDEVVEIWFLMGEAFAAMSQTDVAAYYWERAKDMLECVRQSLEEEIVERAGELEGEEEDELQRQVDEVTCQLEDIGAKLEDALCDADDASPPTREAMEE